MIDPTAKTAAYRFVKAIPDTSTGLRLMHLLAYARRWPKPHGVVHSLVQVPRQKSSSVITLELFRAKGQTAPLPILLHLHGGGYAIGAPCQDYPLFGQLLKAAPCVIAAPHYRRSFQAPYPAALEDCHDVLKWLYGNAHTIGGKRDQIMVMGESAGGGLTAALCLLARDRGEVRIAHQFPFYAMLDDRKQAGPGCKSDLIWSREKNRLAWTIYLGGQEPSQAKYSVPARATDLSDLPRATGFVGTCDLFHEENVSYFARLAAAGVPAELKVIKGAYHGVEVFAPKSQSGRLSQAFVLDAYKRCISEMTSAV